MQKAHADSVRAAARKRCRALLLSVGVVWLAGCAAPAGNKETQTVSGSAERVARMLAGNYAGRSRSNGATDDGDEFEGAALVRLDARIERIASGGVEMSMSQRRGDGEPRNFALLLRTTAIATRLEGSFSPLDARGRPAGSCPVEVSVQRDGFVARTSPATCRFGSGGEEVALIKEIAHDGQRLVIGDRVVDPESGEARMPDRILELARVKDYAGWVGVRESESAWRVAEQITIQSDGLGLDPQDAAGMPLGITLDLAPYLVGDGETPVIRLRVFDSESGELLGQSWADPLATRIGLGLPSLQVGLRLATSR